MEVGDKVEALERHIWMSVASQTVMGDTMDWMRVEMDRLLLINQRMVDTIILLRAGQVHNRDNPIVIEDDSSSDKGTIAEAPDVLEEFHLVPIKDEVGVDSEEEDSEDEIWEIS